MANEKKIPNMVMHTSCMTPIGEVEVWADANADSPRDYLYFQSIQTPAKGKKPASLYTMTASEFKKLAGPVGVLPLESVSTLVGFSAPLLSGAAKGSGEDIRETFSLVSTMLESYEATKPSTGGTVLRKVDDSIVNLLANIYLVKAGTSGNIPNTLDISMYLIQARAAAQNKAEELGQDSLGQFRLKKAKESKKDASSTDTSNDAQEDILDLAEDNN